MGDVGGCTAPNRLVKGELETRDPVDIVLNERDSLLRTPIAPAPPSAPVTAAEPSTGTEARLLSSGLAMLLDEEGAVGCCW